MKILVCNSGSSSLKFGLFEADREELLAEGGIDWTTKPTQLVYRRPGEPEILAIIRNYFPSPHES
jgi:acetate kinase